ncbi:hypothetical protein SAMN05421741_101212 [Paenimyroides ummariense]|uniref:Lipoprotein n=1 Tax=Paenimyroides ummariense TaxID=913024 RepID=A0A1I4WHQ0_9FLAO|nr:hypothetical protein [Paenimyroides ummariense]SFN12539.1 hypothetical protein SAMN05421741_101212 [Paenimyroides ummariense]
MKKYILFFLIMNLFTGCDYLNTYSIVNKSGEDLIVEASYYESYIDSANIKRSLMFDLAAKDILSLDTINYKLKLRLKPDEEFGLGFSINGVPKFDHNKEISIYKNDSLVFYGNQYIIQNLYTNSKQDHTEVLNIY